MANAFRKLLIVGALCLAGWGMHRLFQRWGARIPQHTNAATQMLGAPYVGDDGTGLLHRRRCRKLRARRHPADGRTVRQSDFVEYEARGYAIQAGYIPCEVCEP